MRIVDLSVCGMQRSIQYTIVYNRTVYSIYTYIYITRTATSQGGVVYYTGAALFTPLILLLLIVLLLLAVVVVVLVAVLLLL